MLTDDSREPAGTRIRTHTPNPQPKPRATISLTAVATAASAPPAGDQSQSATDVWGRRVFLPRIVLRAVGRTGILDVLGSGHDGSIATSSGANRRTRRITVVYACPRFGSDLRFPGRTGAWCARPRRGHVPAVYEQVEVMGGHARGRCRLRHLRFNQSVFSCCWKAAGTALQASRPSREGSSDAANILRW